MLWSVSPIFLALNTDTPLAAMLTHGLILGTIPALLLNGYCILLQSSRVKIPVGPSDRQSLSHPDHSGGYESKLLVFSVSLVGNELLLLPSLIRRKITQSQKVNSDIGWSSNDRWSPCQHHSRDAVKDQGSGFQTVNCNPLASPEIILVGCISKSLSGLHLVVTFQKNESDWLK